MLSCFQGCWPPSTGTCPPPAIENAANATGSVNPEEADRTPNSVMFVQNTSVRRNSPLSNLISGRRFKAVSETAVVALSDPGQDLDDEMMYMMMRYLVEESLIDLRGIVTTLAPSYDRARLCRGTLNLLGLPRVPVGVGTDGGDTEGKHTRAPFEEGARSYMPALNSEEALMIEPGRRLLARLFEEAEPKSLTFLIVASLKDAALFLRDNETLFEAKTKEVVIMGGIEPTFQKNTTEASSSYDLVAGTYMVPDTSHNQEFDKVASAFFFNRCQELGVRLIIVSRWSAYAAKMPRETYDQLALSGSSIGRRLRNAQRGSIEQLWARAAAAPDDPKRKGLPPRCDRTWFINTFCGGHDDPERSASQPVWDLVDGFMQYDTMALLAAVPSLRAKFYSPVTVRTYSLEGLAVENLIVGMTQNEPNLAEPKDDLMQLLNTGFAEGLSLNHHFKAQLILFAELRDDTVVDMTLTAIVLRTLVELDVVHCIGIVVATSASSSLSENEQAQVIRESLDEVGLRFVPVFAAKDTVTAAEHLELLYGDALPMGVTLAVTASLTAVSTFVERNPQAFCEKTARVILMSGARRREHAGQWLEPDPDAQNNRLDMVAATKFFTASQELSVPLIVLTRFAAQDGRVPRAIFDVLASHCGPIGQSLCETARARTQALWLQSQAPASSIAERGTLPARCDRAWFLNTFCSGRQPTSEDDIWECVDSLNVYSPLALLAALPGVVKRYLQATPVQVRAATHEVIGWSADARAVQDPASLQKLLLHCLVYGARCNVSEYTLGKVPGISIGHGSDAFHLDFHMSEKSLDHLLPPRPSCAV